MVDKQGEAKTVLGDVLLSFFLQIFLGQGEGVAYRGRALIELLTILDEKPLTAVEDILTEDITRVQVMKSIGLTSIAFTRSAEP